MMSNTLFWSSMRLDVVVCLTAVSALFCVHFSGPALHRTDAY